MIETTLLILSIGTPLPQILSSEQPKPANICATNISMPDGTGQPDGASTSRQEPWWPRKYNSQTADPWVTNSKQPKRIITDEQGRLKEICFIDDVGNPCHYDNVPFAILRFHYDDRGNLIRAEYLDEHAQWYKPDDLPILCGRFDFTYDAQNRLASQTSIGPDGKPYNLTTGTQGLRYATFHHTYDTQGRLIETLLLDAEGRPIHAEPHQYTRTKHAYDDRSRTITTTFEDELGRPSTWFYGAASWVETYDEHGKRTSRRFIDSTGSPIERADATGETCTYDNNGRETTRTGLTVRNGKETPGITTRYEYDQAGRCIREAQWNADSSPAAHRNGAHATITRYDSSGNIIQKYGIDPEEKRIGSSAIIAYDDNGRVVRITNVDEQDNPSPPKSTGYQYYAEHAAIRQYYARPLPAAILEYTYDRLGNRTSITKKDTSGTPDPGQSGWTTARPTYDARSNCTGVSYFDAEGRPVIDRSTGYASARHTYDRRNRRIRSEYFDAEGNPLPGEPRTETR